jgi:hypothetical protein
VLTISLPVPLVVIALAVGWWQLDKHSPFAEPSTMP